MKSVMILSGAICVASATADLASPGFEQGPDSLVVSFAANDNQNLGWFASNVDGERFRSEGAKQAFEGNFYASLLQNAGRYDGAPLGIDNDATGFDRIYAFMDVSGGSEYTLSFMHAGDDRFAYFADTTVVEIIDAVSNTTLAQGMYETPDFFDWQQDSLSFTTDAETRRVAVAFTTMGRGNTSAVIDDINLVPAPSALALIGLSGLAATRRQR